MGEKWTRKQLKKQLVYFFFIYSPPHKRSFKMKGFLFEMQSEEITPSSCFNTDKYRLSTNQMWSEERLQIGGRMVWREENKKEEKHHHQRLIPTEIVPCGQDLKKRALSGFTSVQQVCGGGTCIKVQTGVGEGQLQDQNGHQGSECNLPSPVWTVAYVSTLALTLF